MKRSTTKLSEKRRIQFRQFLIVALDAVNMETADRQNWDRPRSAEAVTTAIHWLERVEDGESMGFDAAHVAVCRFLDIQASSSGVRTWITGEVR